MAPLSVAIGDCIIIITKELIKVMLNFVSGALSKKRNTFERVIDVLQFSDESAKAPHK